MFGYIKVYKPELKIREFDAYKAVYCTLCKQLRTDYGPLARMTLNYDATFFAMLRMAALESEVSLTKGRCPYRPLKKCNHICVKDAELSYAAAVSMIAAYYKMKDTLLDDRFWKRLAVTFARPFLARWYRKARKRQPEADAVIRTFFEQQTELERSAGEGLDRFAHPTAQALSSLITLHMEPSNISRVLASIGYNVGKWVYLVDALDDFEGDRKAGRFNPYLRRLGDRVTAEELNPFAQSQLNICIDQACLSYQLLPQKNFHPILENILYLGLEQVQTACLQKGGRHARSV